MNAYFREVGLAHKIVCSSYRRKPDFIQAVGIFS